MIATATAAFPSMDQWIDQLGDKLAISDPSGTWRASLSGSLNLEAYAFESPSPALIETDENTLIQPRLLVFLDAQGGKQLYAFAQFRVDRGFDPSEGRLRGRLDEYALRYTPWEDGRFNLQLGQFATVVGAWVGRHDPSQNPFVSAPVPYEQVTRISDVFALRSNSDLTNPLEGFRYAYNPIIWGPAYATGASVSGRFERWEWAIEVKNNALLSRPSIWSLTKTDFSDPTVGGRISWRPSLKWEFGFSASEGTYLAMDEFVRGWRGTARRSDYRQAVYLFDFSYALHHLEVWGEVMQARYSAPALESDLTSTAYFIEARYRFNPGFAMAARWNTQWFSSVEVLGDESARWGDDIYRLDLSGNWRLSAHTDLKIELNFRDGEDGLNGWGLGGAAQLSISF